MSGAPFSFDPRAGAATISFHFLFHSLPARLLLHQKAHLSSWAGLPGWLGNFNRRRLIATCHRLAETLLLLLDRLPSLLHSSLFFILPVSQAASSTTWRFRQAWKSEGSGGEEEFPPPPDSAAATGRRGKTSMALFPSSSSRAGYLPPVRALGRLCRRKLWG